MGSKGGAQPRDEVFQRESGVWSLPGGQYLVSVDVCGTQNAQNISDRFMFSNRISQSIPQGPWDLPESTPITQNVPLLT